MSKTKKDQREIETSDEGEAIGTRNEDRLAKLKAISEGVEESIKEEFENPPEDGESEETETQHEVDPSPEPTPIDPPVQAAQTDPLATYQDLPVTRKINGREITKPLKEWMASASKIEAADAYLAQAAEYARRVQVQEPEKPQEVDEDLAIARAIQMGSEEEAVKALQQFRQRVQPAPSISPDELPRIVDERLTFLDAANTFKEEYPDILGDPILSAQVFQRDANMVNSGDSRPYLERYRQIGNELRQWKASLIASSAPDSKQQRKASVTTIPTAHARAVVPDNDQDESTSDVIANMAKARGQAI